MSNKVYNVSVVGVGNMAQTIHIPIILSNKKFKLDTIMDPFIEDDSLKKYAKKLACKWTKDIHEIKSELVVIATPISSHFEVASLLIEKNKYLIVEKPITSSIVDYDKLINKQKENEDKRIFCGHMRRFYRNINLTKKIIQSEVLGQIKSIKLFEGSLYGWDRKYFKKSRNDRRKSIDEGVLFDVGSHSVDSFTYIFDDRMNDIIIEESIVNNKELFSDIFISGYANIKNQEKPFLFEASFSNTISLANMSWIVGEVATLMIPSDDTVRPKIITRRNSQMIELDIKWKFVSPFYTMYENIYNSIENNKESVLDVKNFMNTMKILDSSYNQAKEGTINWL